MPAPPVGQPSVQVWRLALLKVSAMFRVFRVWLAFQMRLPVWLLLTAELLDCEAPRITDRRQFWATSRNP